MCRLRMLGLLHHPGESPRPQEHETEPFTAQLTADELLGCGRLERFRPVLGCRSRAHVATRHQGDQRPSTISVHSFVLTSGAFTHARPHPGRHTPAGRPPTARTSGTKPNACQVRPSPSGTAGRSAAADLGEARQPADSKGSTVPRPARHQLPDRLQHHPPPRGDRLRHAARPLPASPVHPAKGQPSPARICLRFLTRDRTHVRPHHTPATCLAILRPCPLGRSYTLPVS